MRAYNPPHYLSALVDLSRITFGLAARAAYREVFEVLVRTAAIRTQTVLFGRCCKIWADWGKHMIFP